MIPYIIAIVFMIVLVIVLVFVFKSIKFVFRIISVIALLFLIVVGVFTGFAWFELQEFKHLVDSDVHFALYQQGDIVYRVGLSDDQQWIPVQQEGVFTIVFTPRAFMSEHIASEEEFVSLLYDALQVNEVDFILDAYFDRKAYFVPRYWSLDIIRTLPLVRHVLY